MAFLAALFAIVIAFVVMVVIDLVLAFPVMWAWDASMPHIFHLPEITFWQAFSLLILAGLLIKSSQTNSSSK